METESPKLEESNEQAVSEENKNEQGKVEDEAAQVGEGEANEEEIDKDARSIFIKGVDYSASPEEIKDHFGDCGKIVRITILCNKMTGQPLGHAYLEFEEKESVQNATDLLNESLFKGRQLTVMPKRKNIPGMR